MDSIMGMKVCSTIVFNASLHENFRYEIFQDLDNAGVFGFHIYYLALVESHKKGMGIDFAYGDLPKPKKRSTWLLVQTRTLPDSIKDVSDAEVEVRKHFNDNYYSTSTNYSFS